MNIFVMIQVRRGKINERLRCLQDIVPGCYKVPIYLTINFMIGYYRKWIAYNLICFEILQTMGMAVMLDEIINYVQSLQNQVEVSWKLKLESFSYLSVASRKIESHLTFFFCFRFRFSFFPWSWLQPADFMTSIQSQML